MLFGATGDLAKRKLLPGACHLRERMMPSGFSVVGFARRDWTDDQFRALMKEGVTKYSREAIEPEIWDTFARNLHYVSSSFEDPAGYRALGERLERQDSAHGTSGNRLFYLATPPTEYEVVATQLGEAGLACASREGGWTRVVVEKPSTDLESARALNQAVHAVFDESQVFRIDHFLGKESVDNILVFRFANGLFEPVWNRDHIRYVQIDVPETLSIEGRAAFYDATGAYRDMVVTHLFQAMGFLAMEPPVSLSAKHLRDEKEKVFEALKPLDTRHVVRGQYRGYRSEPGVPRSDTETLAAVRVDVENWRWHGVPFFLRSGKSMGDSRQVVTLGFREPPLRMFHAHRHDDPRPAG